MELILLLAEVLEGYKKRFNLENKNIIIKELQEGLLIGIEDYFIFSIPYYLLN